MKKDYSLGMDKNNLSLSVSIGTPGIATTNVHQILTGGQIVKLCESNEDSANIDTTEIGKSEDLKDSFIKSRTVIDFGSIDSSQWAQLAETVSAKCQLSGGFAGVQTYSYDEDDKIISSNGKIVIIDIDINFK